MFSLLDVYGVTAALAVSAGMAFGLRPVGPTRSLGTIAGVLTVVAVTTGGITWGSEAPWIGPVFAITASATAILVAASARRDEPSFRSESYWRRVRLVLSRRY